jgi:hypothetical protein
MNKETEIKTLESLGNADTYFRQAFSEAEIMTMMVNIQNDHPLLLGTQTEHYYAIGKNMVEMRLAEREQIHQCTLTAEGDSDENRSLFVVIGNIVSVTVKVTQNNDGTSYNAEIIHNKCDISSVADHTNLIDALIRSLGKASFVAMVCDNFWRVPLGTTVASKY